jgi:glycosyltransferase involved in cell wall biosynthesis
VEFRGFNYPNKLLNAAFLFLNYPKIENLIKGCDLFFMPNPNFCALTDKTKKVMTVHDLSFKLYPQFFSLKQRLWHKAVKPRQLISRGFKIITDSNNTKNDLIKLYGAEPEKIKVIYPGLNRDSYCQLDKSELKFNQLKEEYNLPENFIFYLGTIEPRKNIEGIIEAFNLAKSQQSDLANLHLVIAGAKGWKFKHVFTTASKSPYADQINFIGYIPEKHKPYIYNLAKLFLFPSFYEGFGLPVLEAQACGLPVITGLDSSFPEVMADSAILVNPDNLTEISRAIIQILTIPELKQELIQKGLANAQRFSWHQCAQQTLDYLIS